MEFEGVGRLELKQMCIFNYDSYLALSVIWSLQMSWLHSCECMKFIFLPLGLFTRFTLGSFWVNAVHCPKTKLVGNGILQRRFCLSARYETKKMSSTVASNMVCAYFMMEASVRNSFLSLSLTADPSEDDELATLLFKVCHKICQRERAETETGKCVGTRWLHSHQK